MSRGRPLRRGSTLVAGVIGGLSGGLWLASFLAMRRARTTVDPRVKRPSAALLSDGPFRISRNPMYVALVGLLVTQAVARRNPLAGLLAGLVWLILDRVQIPYEEAHLADQFGSDYEAYRQTRPRWLGPVR
ncbi:MAG: isoprenylcysteine carboxylmethyltransferase family protein, partial [Propionibacteriaceae bacterium]|jgi:protein-S-isoprenylcysteine O-methyltransferase Ste14|nr:isoprenylcysteine carboxylmethyltransferase family protein [Propionibacteriaceae bacterium]